AELEGKQIVFLPRHSYKHNIPPHRVNYRANIWALKHLGAKRIIAVNAVGGINTEYSPGDIVIADQIIDLSRSRVSTFFEDDDVVHVDFTEPFCPEMRAVWTAPAFKNRYNLHPSGTYVCTEGPRLETAAEISYMRLIGGDMVGMTGMPEAVLAREQELCYLMIAVITNPAAGLTTNRLTTTEVLETMKRSNERVKQMIVEGLSELPSERRCPCKDALKEARL
ncbi:MAG: S-methyl-5'-thioinosine phosphorylase, partial [Nitrospirae bacterium]